MIAQIRNLGIDYVGNQIIEAHVYRGEQAWPPVMIATSNTGVNRLKRTVRRFAEQRGEKVKFCNIGKGCV